MLRRNPPKQLTLLRSSSYGGSVQAYSAEAAASAAKAGRIHLRAHAWGLLRRRIKLDISLSSPVWNKAPQKSFSKPNAIATSVEKQRVGGFPLVRIILVWAESAVLRQKLVRVGALRSVGEITRKSASSSRAWRRTNPADLILSAFGNHSVLLKQNYQIISATGFEPLWPAQLKIYRGELPLLPFGYRIGFVPTNSRVVF